MKIFFFKKKKFLSFLQLYKNNNIKKFIINSATNGPATNAAGNKDNSNKGILFFSFKIVIINLF